MRKFINIADIDKKDLRLIIDNAKLRKEKRLILILVLIMNLKNKEDNFFRNQALFL